MKTNPTRKKRRCQCDPECVNPPLNKKPFCRKHIKCTRKSPLSGYEPSYNPKVYNTKSVRKVHNCFAYAFDYIQPSAHPDNTDFHQPGRNSGFPKWDTIEGKRCPDLISRIRADVPETKLSSFTEKCPPQYSKIALVVDPKSDYHFYRQDSNKYWSHKPGSTRVIDTDADGVRIFDPSIANRNYSPDSPNYNHFCSFMCIPRNKKYTFKRGGFKSRTKKHKH